MDRGSHCADVEGYFGLPKRKLPLLIYANGTVFLKLEVVDRKDHISSKQYMSEKPLVLVVGPTGRTGLPLVGSLLESGDFRVAGIVRPTSAANPEVKDLESKGVQIHAIDWVAAPLEELTETLKGVDILISTCSFFVLDKQTKLVDAAKAAGTVKRFIPCDWASPCPPGVVALADMKRKIWVYAEAAGLPYTSIDIGLWNEATFPPKDLPDELTEFHKFVLGFYGSGKVKSTIVNRLHLGRFVPSILKDERTIGRKVLAHEDEITQEQVWELVEKYSTIKLSDRKIMVSAEQLKKKMEESSGVPFPAFANSLYIRGDNTVEEARKDGYLIAQELYPSVPVQSAEEWAKEYYTSV